jgi:negative regulator of flagellin synthesis FlgM
MHIYGPQSLHGPQSIGAPHSARTAKPATPAEGTAIKDEVNISDAARFIEQAAQVPEMRQDRVNSIRQQIADGTYETQDKFDVAVDRLLDEIG